MLSIANSNYFSFLFFIRLIFQPLLLLLVCLSSQSSAQKVNDSPIALLLGLDKITARISAIEAPLGAIVRFGTLDIVARRCHKRPPEEPPETTVYLEIKERRIDEAAADLFAGWMFSSSPAVSAMEHPVYDVWVLDCKKSSSSAQDSSP